MKKVLAHPVINQSVLDKLSLYDLDIKIQNQTDHLGKLRAALEVKFFLPGRVKTVGLRYVLGVVPGSQLLVSYREVKSVLDFVFPSLTMI